MKLTRRTFTRLGALSGIGTMVLPACKGTPSPAAVEAAKLSSDERLMFGRFAEVYLPTEGTDLKPLSEVSYLDHIERTLSFIDRPTVEDVHTALKLFNLGPYLIGLHLQPFIKLGPDDRIAYIRKWDDGFATQRGIVVLIKRLVSIGYLQDVGAARRLGFKGPISEDAKTPKLGNAPIPVAVPPTAEAL
jgi:hypothetical protein